MMRSKTLGLVAVAFAVAVPGCGGDDSSSSSERTESAAQGAPAGEKAPPAKVAKLYDGENFNPNDIADCLLDADVGAGVSLDGAAIDLHDAQSQVIVEQGNADILVYDDAESAMAAEADYRSSFPGDPEVGLVRNVLWEADPDASVSAVTQLKACLGA